MKFKPGKKNFEPMEKTLLFTVLCSVILVPSNILLRQRAIRAILMRDIVKMGNDMFSILEFGILTTFDKDFAVKVTGTAPQPFFKP
jgi:hypothetical protein